MSEAVAVAAALLPSVVLAQPFPTRCASEGATCSTSGTGDVAFGSGGRYIVLRGVRNSLTCNTSTFGGDPTPGVAKACYTDGSGASSQQGAGPAGYAICTNEGSTCSFSGSQDVAYGAAGQWVSKIGVGSIGCNKNAFDGIDPALGYNKACFIPNAQSASVPMWFTWCVAEGQSCDFSGYPAAAVTIAFGANNKYYLQTVTSVDHTRVQWPGNNMVLYCETSSFALGDPATFSSKNCYITVNSGPGGYKNCAIEGGTGWDSTLGPDYCQLPLSGDWVMFGPAREGGTSGTGTARFFAKTFSGSQVYCGASSFNDVANGGDPASGYTKFCYVR